ncbi:MAG: glycosyltransferase, partial [Verrucomicrobia bacterium]|nr:glycosyltransferase [Cytophagales bacterium]
DLQDPPELLHEFYQQFQQGYDVVYGIRQQRKESFLKKMAYQSFYRLLKNIAYIDLPLDSGDFSLISRRVVNIINQMPEESRFIRGMRTWVGFKQIGVPYEREARAAGTSKYSWKMLFRLAYNGIFNFSEIPIKFISSLGFCTVLLAMLYLIYTVYKRIVFGTVPEGFTALLFVVVLLSGVQLISLGVIGEYVLRIFFQAKNRPLFVIKNRIVDKELTDG